MDNKKIKNAKSLVYDNITFKSKLEVLCYKTLMENGFNPLYEYKTFIVWRGFKPTIPFYEKNKDNTNKLSMKKIIDIKYTPDFCFTYGNLTVFIEIKGFENDVFYIKKKLFRKYLEDLYRQYNIKSIYFEIYTKTQLLDAIKIIKNVYMTEIEKMKNLIGCLPKKDIAYANKFIEKRDFQSLLELVDSDIIKEENRQTKIIEDTGELDMTIESIISDMCVLRSSVKSYVDNLTYEPEFPESIYDEY